MGDVIDSTLMHINDLPIPIPLPIHQRGLSRNIVYYLWLVWVFLGLETIFWDLASDVQNLYSPVSTVTRQISTTTPPPPDQAFLSGILDTLGAFYSPGSHLPLILTVGVNLLSGNHHQFSGAVCWGPAASLRRVGTSCNHYLKRSHFICHDARNLPVCGRLLECETVVVCLRLNYFLSKNHDSYFWFISLRWKYHLPNLASNLYNFHSPSSFDTQIGEWSCSKGNYPVFTARFSRHSLGRIAWWSKRRSAFEASGVSKGTVKTHGEDSCWQKFATLYPNI